MTGHVPFNANSDWTNPYCGNSSNDPLVDKMIGNAYHVVRTVYCNLGNLKLIYDYLTTHGMVVGVKSEDELRALSVEFSKFARIYKSISVGSPQITDYLYIDNDTSGIKPNDPEATGSWVLSNTEGTGIGVGGGGYIPLPYNNGSAVGGELTITLPDYVVGVPFLVVDGSVQYVGYGFTYDRETFTITLAEPLAQGTEVVAMASGNPANPGNPNINNWVTVNWLYNNGSAVGGEQSVVVPFTFQSVPAIWKNGLRYYKDLADRSYTVDVDTSTITLTESLIIGDRLIVQLGGEATVIDFSGPTGASMVGTKAGHTVQEELDANSSSFQDGAKLFDKNDRILDRSTSPAQLYYWDGAFPKDVAIGSTPSGTGGIATGAWVAIGDSILKDGLLNTNGLSLIGGFSSIANLRDYVGTSINEQVFLLAHTENTGVGGGTFTWLPSSTDDDNNGTIIKPTSVTGAGRWVRFCDAYFVEDFGAYNSASDNTQAFADAIKAAGNGVGGDVYAGELNPGIRRVRTRGGPMHITGNEQIIIPAMVDVDLCGAEVIGSGTNTIFVTGGFNQSTGVLESNLSLAENTYRVTGSKLRNGRITKAGIGYNFKNWAEESVVSDITFTDCVQCGKADSSYYGGFRNMTSRNPTAPKTHTEPAFVFSTYVNSQCMKHINVTQRKLAYHFDGAINGQRLEFVNAEGCDKGLLFTGEVMPVEIFGYYEDITDVAIDMGAAQAHRSVKVGGFINNVNTGFYGNTISAGSYGENSYFLNCTTKYNSDPGTLNALTLHIPPELNAINTLPGLPSGWNLSGLERVQHPVTALNSSGSFIAKQNFTGGLVELPFSGNGGDGTETIPFCVQNNAGTAIREVTTAIKFNSSLMVIMNLVVEGQKVRGRVYSDAVYLDGTVTNITVTPSNSSGVLKLTFSGSALPSVPNNIVGIIRMP